MELRAAVSGSTQKVRGAPTNPMAPRVDTTGYSMSEETFLRVNQEKKIEQQEKDLAEWEDFCRWVEFSSGRGDVGLTRVLYEHAIATGEWEPEY